jgi:hypothetical protein
MQAPHHTDNVVLGDRRAKMDELTATAVMQVKAGT